MKKITVFLGKRTYDINLDYDLIQNPSLFYPLKANDKVILITNTKVAHLHMKSIINVLKTLYIKVDNIIIPDGERFKNINIVNKIFTILLKRSYSKDTTLIALGGGVIGDIAGFVAASYLRGIRLIHIPTTLLSQVDSSIGGKSALNHKLGKNMIGLFYQPVSVLIDFAFLKTLPKEELISGLAEVIKYAIISDEIFFSWLEINIDELLNFNIEAIKYCIYRCCHIKANIVSVDEHENGLRNLLNLGHTYGHAIEIAVGYGNWLHGEAVSVGIVMAALTSEYLGILKKEDKQRIITLLKRAGLPVIGPDKISIKKYFFYMTRDKKMRNENILKKELTLIIPITIGKSEIKHVKYDIINNVIIDSLHKE